MNSPGQAAVQERKPWEPLGPLLAVSFGALWLNFYFSENENFNTEFLLGYTLGQAVLVWAVYHILLMAFTKGRVKFALVTFPVIYLSMYAGNYLSADRIQGQSGNEAVAISEINKTYQSFIEQSVDEQGMPQRIEVDPATQQTKASGDLGEIERFTKTFLAGFVEDRNSYLVELDAVQLETAFAADYLSRPNGIDRARVILQQTRSIVQKYYAKSSVRVESGKAQILQLNMSEKSKREMLEGYEKGLGKATARVDAMWNYEFKTVDEFDSILRLLEMNQGKWFIQDGMVYFTEDALLNRYNGHWQEVDRLVKAQEDLQKEGKAQWDANFGAMIN